MAYLLTPGPLSTSRQTKEAMLKDWGSWDDDFNQVTASIRQKLCGIIQDTAGIFTAVPMQGSGTFAIESALGTCVPRYGKVLVLSNGAYGQRIVKTLKAIGRDYLVLDKGDYLPPRGEEVDKILIQNPGITHVVVVHCETSSGILNPIEEISEVCTKHRKILILDAMSSLGAIPLGVKDLNYDVCVSSANKCLEGVPGFGFILVRQELLERCAGNAPSLSLDAYDQWRGFEKTKRWRFTPPTHTVVAFAKALEQYEKEGGQQARLRRYTQNRDTLVRGMRGLGFETLLEDPWLSPIIVTFLSPGDPGFKFEEFYRLMKERDFVIYPGKLTEVPSFRLGCIGQVDSEVMDKVVVAVEECLSVMGVSQATPESIPDRVSPAGLGLSL